LLSKIFNFGMNVDVVEHNPVTGTIPAPETSRDRVLTEDELRQFWRGTEGMLPAMSARLRLALVTAQRGGEICSMRWDELDLQAGVWTIPATKAKNGLAHRVPLSALALELIETLPREDAYVFVGARGSRQHREAVQSIELVDFRPHDLRRTAASGMASIGVSRIAISKILNHVETGVTAIYDRHGYDAEKREELTRWALELRRIVDGVDIGRVVEFPR
jgi:integrase